MIPHCSLQFPGAGWLVFDGALLVLVVGFWLVGRPGPASVLRERAEIGPLVSLHLLIFALFVPPAIREIEDWGLKPLMPVLAEILILALAADVAILVLRRRRARHRILARPMETAADAALVLAVARQWPELLALVEAEPAGLPPAARATFRRQALLGMRRQAEPLTFAPGPDSPGEKAFRTHLDDLPKRAHLYAAVLLAILGILLAVIWSVRPRGLSLPQLAYWEALLAQALLGILFLGTRVFNVPPAEPRDKATLDRVRVCLKKVGLAELAESISVIRRGGGSSEPRR